MRPRLPIPLSFFSSLYRYASGQSRSRRFNLGLQDTENCVASSPSHYNTKAYAMNRGNIRRVSTNPHLPFAAVLRSLLDLDIRRVEVDSSLLASL